MSTRPAPLGSMIDALFDQREKKRALEADVKKVEEVIHAAEAAILERLDSEGLDKSTGKKATVSKTTVISTNIVDWDTFTKYVKRTGYFHLIQRRVSDPAVRELFETKGAVPGLEPFPKTKLNLRTL